MKFHCGQFLAPGYPLMLKVLFPILLVLVATPGRAEWVISVDHRPFPTAEFAATAEAVVQWDNADSREANACTISYAAIELQKHLRTLVSSTSRTSFPIVDQTGPTGSHLIRLTVLADAQQNPVSAKLIRDHALETALTAKGSFAMIPHENAITIIGAERTGTLYGTYALLESWGVRWYGPEPHEQCIPRIEVLTLPAQPLISVPDFKTRGFWVREDKGNEPFYRWMARNRMNFWSIAEPNRPLLHKLGMHLTFGGHHYWEKYLDPASPYPFDHPRFEGDEHLPTDPYSTPTDEYRGDQNGDGQLTFFEARPEWYGLNETEERTPFEGMYGMNICSSNPDPLQFLYGQIVDEVAHGEWQDVASLNFWSIDNGVWCQCADCLALGEPTDRLLLMVHGLDQAIDVAVTDGIINRPIKIVFPIYQQSLPAPTRPLPFGFDYTTNIGTFFPILRCYVHSIDDPTCTEYNTEHWDAFRDWTESPDRHYHGEIFVGEYFNVSVNKSLPVIYPTIIQEDVPKFYAAGARHMHYMHTDTHRLGVKRINNFLFARALWDTSAALSSELSAYFKNLYGPIASEMQEVYRELEFAHANIRQLRYWHHLPERIIEQKFPLFDKTHFQLESSQSVIDDGVDLAESLSAFRRLRTTLNAVLNREVSDAIRARLTIDDQTIRYGENTVFFYDAVARAVIAEHEGDLERARFEFRRSLPFARNLKAETEVVKTATNHHVHANDGLDATRIENAYLELGKRLIPDFEW